MHPALSIILFTTLSGAGLGMIAWLGSGRVPESALLATTIIAFVLTSAGLMASTFHLGHPERAWRAFSQWRTSWLSREGVMAFVTLGLVALWWFLGYPGWLGPVMAACALITVYTTSMIYAQMNSVQQWHTPTTPVVFILMSLSGGGLMIGLASAFVDRIVVSDAIIIALLFVAAWASKLSWWRRADSDIEISDSATATGLGESGQVRLLESPHSGSSYLLDEMGFRVGRKHARKLRRIAITAGGGIPLLALFLSLQYEYVAIYVLSIAVLAHLLGVLAERWLFFAEARHAIMNFYE